MSSEDAQQKPETAAAPAYKTWVCAVCGFVYNERDGAPEEGLAAGTRWADVPDDWICPDCGAVKSDFQMIEI
jgi:rubredoxin